MTNVLYSLVSALGYAAGLGSLTLFILFAGGWDVTPWSVDAPADGPVGGALLVNAGLVALFGLQHTVMARPAFKAWWTRVVPEPIERSVYCLATAAVVCLLCVAWRPVPGVVWNTDHPALRVALNGLQIAGWAIGMASSFMINHFELFGVQQVYDHARHRGATNPPFTSRWMYRVVRHPLQMGLLVGLWATPTMTASHLFLSALLTAYIAIGLHFEEKDLLAHFGEDYAEYRRRVPMLIPLTKRGRPPSRLDASPADSAA